MAVNLHAYLQRWRKFIPFSIPLRSTPNSFDFQTNQARRSMFLRVLNQVTLGMAVVALSVLLLFPTIRLAAGVLMILTVSVYATVHTLNIRGYVRVAAAVFSVMTDVASLAVFASLASEQGLEQALLTETPSLMMAGLAILFAGALVDVRAAFVLAGVNSAILVGLVAAAGSDDPRPSIHLFWWIIAITVLLYERTLTATFDQLRPMSKADAPAPCVQCGSTDTARAISLFAAISRSSDGSSRAVSGTGGGCGSCAGTHCATCSH
jgi:hypothetical protein